ncbi:MAG TPA: hypothetical protein VEQ60_29825 [Longimicrobium sp.]|nr:hypothetical protein [Longimicrobium sp.]
MNGGEPGEAEAVFQRAVVSEDEAYLRAEERLRGAGAEAAPTLREHLDDPDPMRRLTARVVLESIETAGSDFEQAGRYLAALARKFTNTVARTPPVHGVAETLTARFGGRLAEFLALRLVKESEPDDWRVRLTLQYLDRHKTPAANEALIRFAARTSQPVYQQAVAQVLAGSGDPALGQKLAAERQRLAVQGAALPASLAALATPGAAVA